MKQIVTIAALLVMLSATSGELRAQQQIVISTLEGDSPLLSSAQKVMDEAYKQLGITMNVERFPGERALYHANGGLVDGELYRKEGLETAYPKLLRIPVSIVSVSFAAFTQGKEFPIEGWESLLPYRVGYKRGLKVVEENLVKGTRAEAVSTYELAFRKLEAGRSDVVIASPEGAAVKTLRALGLKDILILEPPLVTTKLFHYLHEKNRDLLEPLTAVLQQMEKDGRIQDIQKQVRREWFE